MYRHYSNYPDICGWVGNRSCYSNSANKVDNMGTITLPAGMARATNRLAKT